jgi:hypothetical protein
MDRVVGVRAGGRTEMVDGLRWLMGSVEGYTTRGPSDTKRYMEVLVGISTSVFLIAVGAILAYAVDVSTEGINLDTVGVILMVVGALGVLLSLLFWGSWGGFGGRETVVDSGTSRRRVIEEDVL